jgi:hypothetical protein
MLTDEELTEMERFANEWPGLRSQHVRELVAEVRRLRALVPVTPNLIHWIDALGPAKEMDYVTAPFEPAHAVTDDALSVTYDDGFVAPPPQVELLEAIGDCPVKVLKRRDTPDDADPPHVVLGGES